MVPLRIVGLAGRDSGHKIRDQTWVHLAVTVNLDDNVYPVGNCTFVARHHCTADSLIFRISNDLDSLICAVAFNKTSRSIRTTVIDNINPIDLCANPSYNAEDLFPNPVAYHYYVMCLWGT